MQNKTKQISHYGKQWDDATICGKKPSEFSRGENYVYDYWTSNKNLVNCKECINKLSVPAGGQI